MNSCFEGFWPGRLLGWIISEGNGSAVRNRVEKPQYMGNGLVLIRKPELMATGGGGGLEVRRAACRPKAREFVVSTKDWRRKTARGDQESGTRIRIKGRGKRGIGAQRKTYPERSMVNTLKESKRE